MAGRMTARNDDVKVADKQNLESTGFIVYKWEIRKIMGEEDRT